MLERMQEFREQLPPITARELFTVPNALTFGRLLLSPIVARRLHDDPGGTWKQAAAFVLSDNADGIFARLGDKSELLANLGFRTSEIGRVADPFTDTIVTSEMVVAGLHNGVIPKWLGAAALAQKVMKSTHAISATGEGAEIHVSKLGKRSEFLTNVGIGLLFAAESIEDEEEKQAFRQKCTAVASVGIMGAFLADRRYKAEAERQLAAA